VETREQKAYTRRETLQISLGGALAASGAVSRVASGKEPSATLPGSDTGAGPPVRTRMFWTWDHSTEWLLNHPGAQTIGACNYYSRTQEWFEGDYTRLLEYCGRHHIDAVVVWGLLRDHHGGVESAKRLCEVAARNGVRLLCGVGLCAYGGVYYEGDSPYSLDLRLQKHPELKAVNASGEPLEFSGRVYGNRRIRNTSPSRSSGFSGMCPWAAFKSSRATPVSANAKRAGRGVATWWGSSPGRTWPCCIPSPSRPFAK
jgi:hypothetical protein